MNEEGCTEQGWHMQWNLRRRNQCPSKSLFAWRLHCIALLILALSSNLGGLWLRRANSSTMDVLVSRWTTSFLMCISNVGGTCFAERISLTCQCRPWGAPRPGSRSSSRSLCSREGRSRWRRSACCIGAPRRACHGHRCWSTVGGLAICNVDAMKIQHRGRSGKIVLLIIS